MIDLERFYPAAFIQELEKVDLETDNQTLKGLLDQANYSFMRYYREIFDKHFIAFSKLLVSLGFHLTYRDPNHLSKFLEKLDEEDIPVGHNLRIVKSGPQAGEQQNHYFVFRVQEEPIAGVLLPDQGLKGFLRNPVRQIAGASLPNLPNVNELHHGDYHSILPLCRDLGVKAGGNGMRLVDLLKECPVAVFEYEFGSNLKKYYSSKAAKPDLITFLQSKKDQNLRI